MLEAAIPIRRAIEREDFEAAGLLCETWSRDVSDRIVSGLISREEWWDVTEFYRWSQAVLRCARARMQENLNARHAAGVYSSNERRQPALIRSTF